jgi:hypothetical protein
MDRLKITANVYSIAAMSAMGRKPTVRFEGGFAVERYRTAEANARASAKARCRPSTK